MRLCFNHGVQIDVCPSIFEQNAPGSLSHKGEHPSRGFVFESSHYSPKIGS